ncbi:MAG TPA: radical SAM protein [Syntrophomonadaceae bacterium]|nr:radical SAM protein [Syntrophomonadaceae bacterium]HQA08504.1 radical SAM protein [Syntrophomonadaceae bacterium]HQE24222.1 radical SAM protein [Syntrophomonadaceae bacterium]
MDKSIGESIKAFGLKKVLGYLDADPEKNISKLVDWLIKVDTDGKHVAPQAIKAKRWLDDKDSNWYQLVKSLYTDIDQGVRKSFFENVLVNATVIGTKRQDRIMEKYGCNVPWAILMDPTSACNLRCTGCWAAKYGHQLSMDFATLNGIIEQGKQMGVFAYIYSGGEPLIRKSDIIKLCEKHPDCAFLAFTNGTLIDEKFADDMLRVKNFVPAISIEGFEEVTDARRGKGTFKAVIKAMDLLRSKRLPFGISCTYTRENTEVIGSEEFIDYMIAKGAKFAWFFTYMPVGVDAVPDLMVTPEQREFMYHQIREFRQTKPIFTLDFWNDGEYSGGCIAGGRRYLHINANGDIEPCAFIHYSDSNIHETTLLEALQRPLFMQYHQNQPFNSNHLRPCPLLDNPDYLAAMVDQSGARSTEVMAPEDVHSLCAKCHPAADIWAPVADKLWHETDVYPEPKYARL